MALNTEHPDADHLAGPLPEQTRETLTDTVLEAIRKRCASLPVRDLRPTDEILGYDEQGLPR